MGSHPLRPVSRFIFSLRCFCTSFCSAEVIDPERIWRQLTR